MNEDREEARGRLCVAASHGGIQLASCAYNPCGLAAQLALCPRPEWA
jgi:hypothetical protein